MDYEPRPIDTSGVVLSDDLLRLIERLAESTHDQWALRKLAEGWRYGEKLNQEAKTHPSLVPYERLPESQKEYDRTTSGETLKAICALGYRIDRSDG